MNSVLIFKACVDAIRKGILRLKLNFDMPGRNTYPDFRLVQSPEGYELKGLAYPGREADYDCNSQLPCGEHNGMRSRETILQELKANNDIEGTD